MKEIKVTVKFKEGLHARPAVKLIKTASAFASVITVQKKEKTALASSITQILGACIVCGDEIYLCDLRRAGCAGGRKARETGGDRCRCIDAGGHS